jgi:hypothetical protein
VSIRLQFPELAFERLVFVDTSAPEWSLGATTFVGQGVGKAEWGSGFADDMPFADVERDRSDVKFRFAHVGYEYNIEEIGIAQQLGIPLQGDKAMAARRAYREFMWNVALFGSTVKGMEGLGQPVRRGQRSCPGGRHRGGYHVVRRQRQRDEDPGPNRPRLQRHAGGHLYRLADRRNGGHRAAALQNDCLHGSHAVQRHQRHHPAGMGAGQQRPHPDHRPASQRAGRAGLETAGAGGTARAVAYRNGEDVAALHLPAPHRFEAPRTKGTYGFVVPGWFRTGGVELRRTYAFRYLDGI